MGVGEERDRGDRLVGWLSRLSVEDAPQVARDLRDTLNGPRYLHLSWFRRQCWLIKEVVLLVIWSWLDALRFAPRAGPRAKGPSVGTALRGSLRALRGDPVTVLAGGTILAIGFGAAATIAGTLQGFSRPLPVPDGDRVVQVRIYDKEQRPLVPGVDVDPHVLQGLSALSATGRFVESAPTVRGPNGQVFQATGVAVDVEGLALLRVSPRLGRLPRPGETGVALVSSALLDEWGSEVLPTSPIRVDGELLTVIGVMPEGFHFPFRQELWTLLDREGAWSEGEVFGRLAPEARRGQAEAELTARLVGALPELGRVEVLGFVEKRSEGGEEVALVAVLLLVLILLFVSCSNVSNLLLIRSLDRSRAVAVHQALGASPLQACLQVIVEAILVALVGASMGLALAWGSLAFIQETMNAYWGYFWMEVSLQPAIAAFLLGLALLVGGVSGLGPGLRAFKADLVPRLREGSTRGGGSPKPGLFSSVLLSSQVAFSFVALVAAVFMARGLLQNREVAPGFPASEVTFASITLPGESYQEWSSVDVFRRRYQQSLEASTVDGQIALGTGMPGFRASYWRMRDTVQVAQGVRQFWVRTTGVTSGYFSVFGVALEEGRLLRDSDGAPGAPPVTVVSRSFARDYLVDGGLGVHLALLTAAGDSVDVEVVGVVSDLSVYPKDGDRRTRASIYVPLALDRSHDLFAFARGDRGLGGGALLSRAAWDVDPDVAVSGSFVGRGPALVEELLGYIRRLFQTSGFLGLVGAVSAVAVAAVGLASLLGYEMVRRRRELGVRLALGAGRRRILVFVLRRGLVRVAPGIVVGCLLVIAGVPALGVFLGSSRGGSLWYVATAVLGFLGVSALASVAPAVRAASIDPRSTLQEG